MIDRKREPVGHHADDGVDRASQPKRPGRRCREPTRSVCRHTSKPITITGAASGAASTSTSVRPSSGGTRARRKPGRRDLGDLHAFHGAVVGDHVPANRPERGHVLDRLHLRCATGRSRAAIAALPGASADPSSRVRPAGHRRSAGWWDRSASGRLRRSRRRSRWRPRCPDRRPVSGPGTSRASGGRA